MVCTNASTGDASCLVLCYLHENLWVLEPQTPLSFVPSHSTRLVPIVIITNSIVATLAFAYALAFPPSNGGEHCVIDSGITIVMFHGLNKMVLVGVPTGENMTHSTCKKK